MNGWGRQREVEKPKKDTQRVRRARLVAEADAHVIHLRSHAANLNQMFGGIPPLSHAIASAATFIETLADELRVHDPANKTKAS
jgi:hypothetical protein